MLDRDDQSGSAAALIRKLRCHVQIPEKLRERFETQGIAPATPDDRRRTQRVRCRNENNLAGLQLQATFPTLPRTEAWNAVYLVDMSRTGMQVLHSEPLYPGERARVLLQNGSNLQLDVVRCRRLGEACFAVGARFADTSAS